MINIDRTSPSRIAQPGTARDADPVTTEVVRNGLVSGAELMRRALCRTAFSPIIYEVSDFCCALYDRNVRLLAQARSLPLWLGTMNFVIDACVAAVGGMAELADGDVIVHTGAYETGSHAQDMAIVVPVFLDHELVGFATTKAHQLDLGAMFPYCTNTTDVFQEGVTFPGVRLYRGGVLQEDMYRTLLANTRAPANLSGDVDAMIGCCRIGAEALCRLITKYGRQRFDACCEAMFDHGEAVMRGALADLPDGEYVGHNCLDHDGIDLDVPVPFEVVVRIKGDELTVDFTSAPPEAAGPFNCLYQTTVSAARFAIVSMAGRHEAINEGHFRPIRVETTEGTLFHPRPPSAIFLYFVPGMLAIDAIHRALADIAPDTVAAGSGGDLNGLIAWRIDPTSGFHVAAADHSTGQGASSRGDGGPPLMHISCSGGRNTPAEVWETSFPDLLVERMELLADTAGAGRYRGGPALALEYRALNDFSATLGASRMRLAPWGLFGGGDAVPNDVALRAPDDSVLVRGNVTDAHVAAGSLIEYRLGGGGGWGRPAERDPAAVAEDVLDGYLTEAVARRDYPHAFAAAAIGGV